MPRIDPTQLLRTLSVLLSTDGGIKSAEEVHLLFLLLLLFLLSLLVLVLVLFISNSEYLDRNPVQ